MFLTFASFRPDDMYTSLGKASTCLQIDFPYTPRILRSIKTVFAIFLGEKNRFVSNPESPCMTVATVAGDCVSRNPSAAAKLLST